MSRRKPYLPPGYNEQPVDWFQSVAFKKPRGRKLLWVHTAEKDVAKASALVRTKVKIPPGHVEYGISKTHWRSWAGYSEIITKADYDVGPKATSETRFHGLLT